MLSIARSLPTAGVAQAATTSGRPPEVTALATALELGPFKSVKPVGSGEVAYDFQDGTIIAKRGRPVRAVLPAGEQGPDTVSAKILQVAAEQQLKKFIDEDAAMGGHLSYNFQRGSVLTHRGQLSGVYINPPAGTEPDGGVLLSNEVLAAARKHRLGAFVRASNDEHTLTFQRGFVQTNEQGKVVRVGTT